MKVEVSLFAGLLVIATTLLARAQIQALEGALLSMAVEGLKDCWQRAVSCGERVIVVLKQVSYVDSAGKTLLAEIYRQTAKPRP
jgi:ABC-type transporter Mla MlaB component